MTTDTEELSFIEYIDAVDAELQKLGKSMMDDDVDFGDLDSAQTAGETPEECAQTIARNRSHPAPPWSHGRHVYPPGHDELPHTA